MHAKTKSICVVDIAIVSRRKHKREALQKQNNWILRLKQIESSVFKKLAVVVEVFLGFLTYSDMVDTSDKAQKAKMIPISVCFKARKL